MKALVFAAGLGTRLRPLTDQIPKALVKVGGLTLLERTLQRLAGAGVTSVMVNVHHHAALMKEFIAGLNLPGMSIEISDETDQLLDTGGGLKKAAWFLEGNDPFVICNVDILTNLSLGEIIKYHLASGALATLAVKNRPTSRYLLFDQENRLCGWENRKTGERKSPRNCPETLPLAFSGIHVVNSALLNLIALEGVFSMIDLYLDLAAHHKIMGWRNDVALVMDLGKPEELAEAEKLIASGFLS